MSSAAGTAAATTATAAAAGGLLRGRRIVVTGVLTDRSLAFHAARSMQEHGAEIVLTGFGRAKRLTARAAEDLPRTPDVLDLDVLEPGDPARLAASLAERWDHVDGVLHSIAFAPSELFDLPFAEVPAASIDLAMHASAYSLRDLTAALLPLLRRSPSGGSVLALTVMNRATVHAYAWMAVVKATLDRIVRQLAVELGPDAVRVNLLACGPVRTNAGSVIPGLDTLAQDHRERAPLGWDDRRFDAIAGPACFMMSTLSRLISGEIIHVDGGRHAAL